MGCWLTHNMSFTFYIVYQALEWMASVTGLTYKEINIVVFYGIVPMAFFLLIDKILGKAVCLSLFSVFLAVLYLTVSNWTMFAERMFDASVDFLQWFRHVGISYDLASVVLCVLVPLCAFFVLLYLAYPRWFHRHLPGFARVMAGPQTQGYLSRKQEP